MLIRIGTLGRPHGIKGGISVRLLHDQREHILHPGLRVTVASVGEEPSPADPTYLIESVSKGPKVVIYLEGITDRDQVESFIPKDIYVTREQFPELEDSDEVYIVDLIGMSVFSSDKPEEKLGSIVDTYSNGAQEVIVIETLAGEQIELPFVEAFFPLVDMEEDRVEVSLPEWT